MQRFDLNSVRANWEKMRLQNYLFVASYDEEYNSVWIRDNTYCAKAYRFLRDRTNAWRTMRQLLNVLKYEHDAVARFRGLGFIPMNAETIFAIGPLTIKYTRDLQQCKNWGNHQVDAIGLFFEELALLELEGVQVIERGNGDMQFLQDMIYYLGAIQYAFLPDLGQWEECLIPKSSSRGAGLKGLMMMRRLGLFDVPEKLIADGEAGLYHQLPFESLESCNRHPHHTHCCDSSLLNLIWPLDIVSGEMAGDIIKRLSEGHEASPENFHSLLGYHGFRRYPNDNFWANGCPAEWPMFFFWMSIIHSFRGEYDWSGHWFEKGLWEMEDNKVFELIVPHQGPNRELAWAYAMAIIAYQCLLEDLKTRFSR